MPVIDLLDAERHEDRERLRGQGPKGVDPAGPEGQRSFQAVQLLEPEDRHLAEPLSCDREEFFRIVVELFLGVRRMHQCQYREHHSLVAGRQVFEELPGFLPLFFHVVRHDGGEVIVHVLLTLPVRDIGLHAEEPLLNLPDGLIGRDRDDVDRKHQVPVDVRELCHHLVADIRSVVPEQQDAAIPVPDPEVVAVVLIGIRTYIVAEVMTFAHVILQVKIKGRFFSRAHEIVDDPEPFDRGDFFALGAEPGEVTDEVRSDPGEVQPRFIDAPPDDRDRDVLVLDDRVAARCLVEQHPVILLPVFIQPVVPHPDQDLLLEVQPVQPAVVDGDLCRRA